MVETLELKANAKINLGLEVVGRRADGYHNLETIFQEISLGDRLCLSLGGQGITLEVDDPTLSGGSDNLAYRAAVLFLDKYEPETGVTIKLYKNIPTQAGLGGGSSDAAAVLKGLNELCSYPFSDEELADMGLSLGSDVPFFIKGGTAYATQRGEALESIQTRGWRAGIVIIKPEVSLSTAMMYNQLNSGLTSVAENIKILRLILIEKRFDQIDGYLFNRFEEAAFGVSPQIKEIKERLVAAGCSVALLCGSGSAVFGLTQDIKAARLIADTWKGDNVFVAEVVTN